MVEILFKELSYAVVGAAMEIHRTMGAGFLEPVYQVPLTYEFRLRAIPFDEQVHLPVYYKGQLVGEYVADFVIDGKFILELKAVIKIHEAHSARATNNFAAIGFYHCYLT